MRRYWVTLEDSDYDKLEEIANSKGTSVGSISKDIVLAFLGKNNKREGMSIEQLILSIKSKMEDMSSESSPFIVKDLIPEEWSALSRSDKMICSKALARFVYEDNNFYVYTVKNGVNYYKHK